MPNWCMNNLDISHDDPAKMKELADRLESLEQDQYKDLIGFLKAFDPDWAYREACSADFSITEDTISANFDTAWSPPTELYETLEEQGFTVWATYYEPGMQLTGIYQDGWDNSVDLGDIDEDFWDTELGKELDDSWGIQEDMAQWEDEEDWDEDEES